MTAPLTLFRHPLRLKSGTRNDDWGNAFRVVREAYGLSVQEVAAGWNCEKATIHALENGRPSFGSVQDLRAAMSQLFLWGSEREVRG